MAQSTFFKEHAARFFENPSRESFRELMRNNLGEFPNCDFKEQWPDGPNLARHTLDMCNSGGGLVVVGVRENEDKTFDSTGMPALVDKIDTMNQIKSYLPSYLLTMLDIGDFAFEESEYPQLVGKMFQILHVSYDTTHIPFLSIRSGNGIRDNAIYVRRGASTSEATHEEVERVLNSRIETGYSTTKEITLKEHLEQLMVLVEAIPRYRASEAKRLYGLGPSLPDLFNLSEPNPNYPEEASMSF